MSTRAPATGITDPSYNKRRERFFSTLARGGSANSRPMKISIQSLAMVALTVIGFALSPKAQAVSPPPDGSYSGGNTAEGQDALLSLGPAHSIRQLVSFRLGATVTNSFNTRHWRRSAPRRIPQTKIRPLAPARF